ncbi:MAG: SUMF1/EgtB/PvdO family nonheme iron enzyme [Bacteroidia bacterium]|nr:SUMF1/EgtB/PvdO family nonheme iron enzyme [Bacteroidia bacterium]
MPLTDTEPVLRRNHLLVIGIDAYEYWTPLNNAVRDADAIRQVLLETYHFEPDPIVPPLYNKEATRKKIQHTLRELAKLFKDETKGYQHRDNLLIYFSGHGHFDKIENQGYWIPVEAAQDDTADYVSNTQIRQLLTEIPAHHIAVLSDACFAGTLLQQNKGNTSVADRYGMQASRWVLSSGRDEPVSDGAPGEHSPFARHILEYLQQHPAQEWLISHLYDYLRQKFSEHQYPQTPVGGYLNVSAHKGGEFVFYRTNSSERLYQAARQNPTLAAWLTYLRYVCAAEAESARMLEALDSIKHLSTPDTTPHPDIKRLRDQIGTATVTLDGFKEKEKTWVREKNTLIQEVATWKKQAETLQEQIKKAEKDIKTLSTLQQQLTRLQAESQRAQAIPPGQVRVKGILIPLPEMVRIRGGIFRMGSDTGDDDEKPVHVVKVPDFMMGKYPVTFEAYDLYCEIQGIHKPGDQGWGRGRRPVINISWDEAQAYCRWLSGISGQAYRLPTEAEWEYAAGGGADNRTTWAGTSTESQLEKYAWYTQNANGQTHPVGEKDPNALGLYDLSGNVREWCEDDWHNNYLGAPENGAAWTDSPQRGSPRVIRGGGWGIVAQYCRVSYRGRGTPDNRSHIVGLRLSCPSR